MAAALATGLRGEIPDGVRQQMRDSGLAHLLAISGLHIGLVTAFVFALVRGGLALGPGFALRWPLKKIAAVVALLAAAIYMMLAGATVPTQRAFIMTAIILVAMLLNWPGISLPDFAGCQSGSADPSRGAAERELPDVVCRGHRACCRL